MSDTPLIVSVSGIRGVVGRSLTPSVAGWFAAAYARYLVLSGPLAGSGRPGTVVVSQDGRATGGMMRDAVVASLAACGCQVLDLGVTSTPTCGFYVKSVGAAGGIQITASHNPPEWNGLKLYRPEGFVLSPQAGQQVAELYHQANPAWASYDRVLPVLTVADPFGPHLHRILSLVDVAAIRARRFRVLLDVNHGSGAMFAPRLLETLGCQVTVLGGSADGQFEHLPEPTEVNLAGLADSVRRAGVDLAFATDPDADRLAVVDETGRYIGEEYTLALAIGHRASQARGPVVINGSTSMLSEMVAKAAGCPVYRTPVGEVHVAEKMLEVGALIGGEGNGGVIDPRVGLGRDSAIGMALILDLLARQERPLSHLVEEMPRYAIHKDKMPLDRAKLGVAFDTLEQQLGGGQVDRADGLRIAWDDAWVQVRASNTEPIVRIFAEAADPAHAAELVRRAREAVAAV